jgi:hypothetical protein
LSVDSFPRSGSRTLCMLPTRAPPSPFGPSPLRGNVHLPLARCRPLGHLTKNSLSVDSLPHSGSRTLCMLPTRAAPSPFGPSPLRGNVHLPLARCRPLGHLTRNSL